MADTVLILETGTTQVSTETIGSVQMPVSKIHLGGLHADTGPVTATNAFPVIEPALTGTWQTTLVTVATGTATRMDSAPLTGRKTVTVRARMANTGKIYIGPSAGDATFELAAGEARDFDFAETVAIYGITTGSNLADILEVS